MQQLRVLVILLLTLNAEAATKLFMRDTFSTFGTITTNGAGYGCFRANEKVNPRSAFGTQGSSAVTRTFAPTATAPPCAAQTGNSNAEFIYFYSRPISSPVTISGNIDFQAGCNESSAALNAGYGVVLYKWSAREGGIVSTIMTSADSTECAGANIAIAAAAPTSTAMAVGDRIVFVYEIRNVGGAWGGNSTLTFSFVYGAATTVYGDTWANFADTISFSAETDNGRAIIQGQ